MIQLDTIADIASVKVGNDDFATFFRTGSDGNIRVRITSTDTNDDDMEYLKKMEDRKLVLFYSTLEVAGNCWIYAGDCGNEKVLKLEPGRYFVYVNHMGRPRVIFDKRRSEFCAKYAKELEFVKNVEKTGGQTMLIADERRINMFFDLFVRGGLAYVSEEGKTNRMKIEIERMIQCENDYDRWRENVTDCENNIKRGIWNEMTNN